MDGRKGSERDRRDADDGSKCPAADAVLTGLCRQNETAGTTYRKDAAGQHERKGLLYLWTGSRVRVGKRRRYRRRGPSLSSVRWHSSLLDRRNPDSRRLRRDQRRRCVTSTL